MQQDTFFLNLPIKKLSCQKISKQFFVYFQENIKTSKQQDQKQLCTCYLGLTHAFHCWEVVCVEVKTALDKSISTVITHCANAINFLASSLAP